MLKKLSLTLAFIGSLYFVRWFYLGRKYVYSKKSLRHKRILYIGPTSSLGVELIKEICSREAELSVATSEPEIASEIYKNSFFESNVQVELIDFSRLQSVGEFCNRLIRKSEPIDILINGIELIDHPPELTEDRIEIGFQTNYLTHFLVTVKLLPLLKRARDARIINITCASHRTVERTPKKEFHQLYKDTAENRKLAFAYSKFCLTSFGWKLSEILRSPNVSVHCVDPGNFSKNPLKHLIAKTPNEAIQGVLYAILSDRKPGFYIEGIEDTHKYNPLVCNHLLADILWTISRKLCERIVKPSEFSKCLIDIFEINNLNVAKHQTNYLLNENIGKEFWVEIGHGVTPIDCYLEEFLKKMFMDETSKCFIDTKSSGTIQFTMRLKRIEFGGYFYEKSAMEMLMQAKVYKDNGVKMFKLYPPFAHNYFNLAAKCLLAFNPLDDQDGTIDGDVKRSEFQELLQTIYLNIGACLLKQQRYDDVLHVLNYVTTQDNPSEKAVYRLALAYFNLKQFENAKVIIEKIDYKNNKDLVQLMTKICEFWKVDHDKYSNMVKKMFS